MLKKSVLIVIVFITAACTSPAVKSSRLELVQNVPPISITDAKECRKKKLVYAEDGSLWIK